MIQKKEEETSLYEKTGGKMIKKYYWLKAGFFFTLFEGIFWAKGDIIFFWIFKGADYNLIQLLFSFIAVICSIFMFGLFIKYTAKEVIYYNN